ncbi:hypothetical protein PATSB16_07870 [Pandoraea thiooxydans]|nr:hypothetical protein PATSB16_07870 [Pandoraea thiooxydans]
MRPDDYCEAPPGAAGAELGVLAAAPLAPFMLPLGAVAGAACCVVVSEDAGAVLSSDFFWQPAITTTVVNSVAINNVSFFICSPFS